MNGTKMPVLEDLSIGQQVPQENDLEETLDNLKSALGMPADKPLVVVGIGAGAWGSVFISMLQKKFQSMRDKVHFSIWRREGRTLDKPTAVRVMDLINESPDIIRRLRLKGRYLKYVDARLGERTLTADEVLADGFCVNMLDTPLLPLRVVTNLMEAVWNADIIINAIPSTDIRQLFADIGTILKERESSPVVLSLAKGVEFSDHPAPHILTPSGLIHEASGVPMENILYLGGPNIASEVWKGEYATARICGGLASYRLALAKFCSQASFVVWENPDLFNHEIMGGLKNVYAIGAGIIKAAAHNSATSMAVYFSNACAEMVFISHLLTGVRDPIYLAGPLLADVYVTLLKGRNAWYGERIAAGEIKVSEGANVPGRGLIQGVSAVGVFHDLLSDTRLEIPDPITGEFVAPIELLPILNALNDLLFRHDLRDLIKTSDSANGESGELNVGEFLLIRMKDQSAVDPERRLRLNQNGYAHDLRSPHHPKMTDEDY